MNEYRVPELKVQNDVLKSLSFLFEYNGEMGKDYIYVLEDALMDRDRVHGQTATSVVKHIALGVVGLGCEDALVHLMNNGLFHPARKVREVYWKIYNSLYIGSQDALVAAYPLLEDEQNNIYSRPELMMFI